MFTKNLNQRIKTKLSHQKFDSDIFKRDFYRISNINLYDLDNTLSELKKLDNYIIDTKIDSSDIKLNNALIKQGFLKICTQVEFILYPKVFKNNLNSTIRNQIEISDKSASLLAENFIYDRFSQDSRFNVDAKNLLYKEWIINSMKNINIPVASINDDFCSFKVKDNAINIDLLSVVEKRKGHATALLSNINNYAIEHDIESIKVITETENLPAVNTYLSNDYKFNKFISCFHYFKIS